MERPILSVTHTPRGLTWETFHPLRQQERRGQGWVRSVERTLEPDSQWLGQGHFFGQLMLAAPVVARSSAWDHILGGGSYRTPVPRRHAVLEIMDGVQGKTACWRSEKIRPGADRLSDCVS